jgi:TP901 family phage tail tape measure protein
MADEIVNKLGFSVEDALRELQRLDNALQTAGNAFQTFGTTMNAWNSQAASALQTMKDMASAASRLSTSMSKMGGGAATPAAQPAAAATSSLWLPSGVSEEIQRANQAMSQLGGSAGTAGAALQDAGNKGGQAGKDVAGGADDADKKIKGLTISWQTLARVVMTQMIVRAMSQIRDALHEAVTESIEFQRRIAEVQTVAPKLGGSFGELTAEAAQFAKQFNIPLAQATEGLYETISDQFSGMSERANVMSAAMKLAKVGVMDFQDATTLLTGTLNAFGMASEQADAVAAKYFTTINLGHVRGKELADTMGQVIPIASQLGVSLDELNAAMIAMTIGGMDAHKSVTALRGAMTAFLKPSEDMKKVIRELGFSSAEQVVQAKGFQGALQAVAEASDNMASEIAKSFRNVRALTAELRLTGEGAVKVEEAMKAMAISTPEMLDKIYRQFISTDAEKLTREINRLKIDLTQDMGSALTHALGSMMQFAGGADRMSSAIQAIAMAAIPAAGALTILAGAFALAHLSMGPIGWTLLGITAALSLFAGGVTYSTAQSINETRRLSDEQRKATLEYLKNKEEELRVLRETEAKKMAEENRSWENRSAVIRKDYFKALDNLRDKNKEIIESDRQAMQSIVASQERVVAAYRSAANAAIRIVQDSQNRRVTLENQASDKLFKDRLDMLYAQEDAERRADATLRRSWDLEAQGLKALGNAQTQEDVQRAQAVLQRAKSYLDEGTALAKTTDNTWLKYQAERSILSNMDGQIRAEKQLEQLQATRAQKLADEAAKEQQRLDTMKSLMKAILADLQAFDKHGVKTPGELAAQQARLSENLGKFQKEWMGGQKVEVADLLAFDSLQRRVALALEGGVSQAEVGKLFASPKTFADFRQEIEKGIGPVQVMLQMATIGNPRLWEATKGMTAEESMAVYSQELQRSTEIVNKFNENRAALVAANKAVQLTQGEVSAALDHWVSVGWVKDVRDLGGTWEMFTHHVENTPLVKQAREELVKAAARFTTPGAVVSTDDLDKLQAAYNLYLGVLRPSEKSKTALDEALRKASGMVGAAEQVQTLTEGLNAMESSANEAMRQRPLLERALKAAEALKTTEEAARKAKESTDGAQTSAEGAGKALSQVSEINMTSLVSQIQEMASAMWDTAMAAGSLQYSTPGVMTAAKGGLAWKFLAGGGAAGTDVIPAMLSPGEVVVNAASARRFAAQLTAINAGVQPVYRNEGGSVTNIGDINVTVNGGGTSRQTARAIAVELRRELRRGTATL